MHLGYGARMLQTARLYIVDDAALLHHHFCALASQVYPSPATRAIFTCLKAGETVYRTGELPKSLKYTANYRKNITTHYEPLKNTLQTSGYHTYSPAFRTSGLREQGGDDPRRADEGAG